MVHNLKRREIVTLMVVIAIVVTMLGLMWPKSQSDHQKFTEDNSNDSNLFEASLKDTLPRDGRKAAHALEENDYALDKEAETQSTSCDAICKSLVEKLSQNETLSLEEASTIAANAAVFAALLADKPEILAALLATLQQDEGSDDNGIQAAASAVLAALTPAQKMAAGRALTSYGLSPSHRMVGLKLLAPSIADDWNALNDYNRLLTTETDPRVFAVAINMTLQVKGSEQIQDTLSALTTVIRSSNSPYQSGTALIAKANLAPSANFVRDDVFSSIESTSEEQQQFGLEAFSTFMDRQNNDLPRTEDWSEDPEFRELITNIANNEQADPESQNDALLLMERYF